MVPKKKSIKVWCSKAQGKGTCSTQQAPLTQSLLAYLWLVGNGGMGYNYNYHYYLPFPTNPR